MPESRQQRRARERAEHKAATRPGPRPQPAPVEVMPPRDMAYAVDVTRTEPDPREPDDAPGWIAEGGIDGDSSGVAYEWTESLAELVADVADDLAGWRERYPGLPIVWRLDGDEQDMTDAAAREGVELPR